jgi:hypothetical protein
MARSSHFAALACAVALAACGASSSGNGSGSSGSSGSSGGSSGGSGSSSSGSSSSGGSSGSSSGSSSSGSSSGGSSGSSSGSSSGGSSGSSSGSSGGNDYAITIGPIDVPAGVETTKCIVEPFGNTAAVVAEGFDSTLALGSHHLIAYLTTSPVNKTPVDCSPFTGVVSGGDVPLGIIDRKTVSFAMPPNVGQDIPANANVKVEAHYINTTSSDLQGSGLVTFHTVPKATAGSYQPASFLFYGTGAINIPPNASFSTGPLFQAGPANTKFFLAMTHQHRLGTGVQLWASAQKGDQANQLLDDTDWSNPSWKTLTPMFSFDGTSGLTYQCDWTNTTNSTVTFGESALQEMCFVGGYYYPSKGFEFCLNGACVFR